MNKVPKDVLVLWGVEEPSLKQSGAGGGPDSVPDVGVGKASPYVDTYTTCPVFDDDFDETDDETDDEGGYMGGGGGGGMVGGDDGVLGTPVESPGATSTPKTNRTRVANRKTRQKRKTRGREKGQKTVKWTKDERLWLWECASWVLRGVPRLGKLAAGKQGWKEIHEVFCTRDFGTTKRSVGALRSQLDVILGGKLTVMERQEVVQKVARDLSAWSGESFDETFEGFESGGEGSDVSGEVDFAREVVGDGATNDTAETGEGGYVLGGQLLDTNPIVVLERHGTATDGLTGQDKTETGKGGYVLGGQTLDINPKVVLTRQDTWRATDGTERELRGVELEVLELLRKVKDNGRWEEVPNLRAVERKRLMVEVDLVEGVMHNLVERGMDVTQVNRLLYSGGAVVALRLGLKLGAGKKRQVQKPWWQRRIEKSIVMWRGHLSKVEEIRKGHKVGKKVRAELERKYQLTERGALSVSTFLKNKIQAGSTKIRWHEDKNGARRQNALFRNNQKQLFKELGGDTSSVTTEGPDANESKLFWEGIWSVEVQHNVDASWLGDVREKMKGVKKMDDVVVELEGVKRGIGRMSNWKAPGPDQVRGFWFKKFSSLHLVLTDALKECVLSGEVPGWMVKGRTVLIQKDPAKGRSASNYRPIACLPLMWKLLTGIFAEEIYDHLHTNSLLPDEQKGCRKQSRGTKDQLLIDREVLKEARRKQRCLSMAWIDYKKAYDMVPHSWILETLTLTRVAENIRDLLERSMSNWKTILTSNGQELGEVGIRRGIFQGDTLSPLLFVVAMIPLSYLLNKESMGYKFGKEGKKINHLLFMDDLKLYGRNRVEVEGLVGVVKKFSDDIGMEFGIDKCATIEIRHGKQVECSGIELPGGAVMKEVEESGYKYLGVLEGACIMNREMKDLVRKEYYRRVKLVAGSWLLGGNMVHSVNTWAVSVVRYTAGILKWSNSELTAMDGKTRKLLTMKGAFHLKSDVDRLYMKRQVGGRGLISIADCVKAERLGLEEYADASEEWMLQEVSACIKAEAKGEAPDETKIEFKQRKADQRKAELMGKKLHGKFFRETKDVADERSWQWLRRGSLYKTTEGYVCAAQENALATRNYLATVVEDGGNDKCRMCGEYVETVGHLVSACKKMAQTDYRRRHDKMGLRVYWEVCGRLGLTRSAKWYEETPDPVRRRKDGLTEVWWDQTVSTPTKFDANRPDMMVIDREAKRWYMVDFSVPWDPNVAKKEKEKVDKYKDLATEVGRMNAVKVEVVPLVVGALGVVSKDLVRWLKRLGIGDIVGELQTAALIGTVAILRKVLDGGDTDRNGTVT